MVLENSISRPESAHRGDIWYVNLDPTQGSEIKKKRTCVIISADGLDSLPVKIVVPITGWKKMHDDTIWTVPIEPTMKNGLSKKSVADALQTRCVSIKRFDSKIGYVSVDIIQEIVAALASIVEHI